MKRFLVIIAVLSSSLFLTSCGSIDFTKSSGSGSELLSLLGLTMMNFTKAPDPPVNLQATPIATDRIDLSWDCNGASAMGLRIERSTGTNANFIEIESRVLGTARFYHDETGLSPATTYYYRIRAYNSGGNSDYSNITYATTYTTPPLTPANPSVLQAAVASSTQVDLTWHDNSDNETGFCVERRAEGEANFTAIAPSLPAGTTSYSAAGLDPRTVYFFRVMAFNGNGNSGYSNEAIVAICPAAPSGLTASVVSSSQINLSWTDNSNNETGFRVERSTSTNGSYGEIVGNLPAGSTSYSCSGLGSNTLYYFRVRASNGYGTSGYSNEVSARTNDIIPYSPTGLTATAMSSSRIDLDWTDNAANETGFIIERSANNVNFTLVATAAANATSYSNTGLSSNSTYYYRVRAHNGAGDSGNSNVASALTFDVVPAAPANGAATAASSSQINLTWTDNSDNESEFRIERSEDNSVFTQVAAVMANRTWYNDTGLSASTTYYYRVRAHNSIGDSGYTAASATTSSDSATQIIADHTVVARYTAIPQRWIDEVKKMWVNVPGESHSQAYRTGMTLLMQQDARFAAAVTESGAPGTATSSYLRVSRALRNQYNSWNYGTGEADWYTWYAANPSAASIVKNHIAYCSANNYGPVVIGFGWCWDMTWQNAPGGTEDPVYHVRWAGSSEGGPDGNRIWGLDSGDNSLTGNRVSMDTYLNSTEAYRTYCVSNSYPVKVVFTTGPVDGYTGENGYQRHLKHEYIRSFVRANGDRVLFDYADILCYDDNGTQNIVSWTDSHGTVRTYPIITSTNMGDGSVGHIGSAGALRLAKAQWWMLARLAGWDGVSN